MDNFFGVIYDPFVGITDLNTFCVILIACTKYTCIYNSVYSS